MNNLWNCKNRPGRKDRKKDDKGGSKGGNRNRRPTGAPGENDVETCALHNKVRKMDCLEICYETGKYVCKRKFGCKYKGNTDEPKDGEDRLAMCIVHNKERSKGHLELNAEGNYQCVLDHKCKVGGLNPEKPVSAPKLAPSTFQTSETTGYCYLHNKPRVWKVLRQTEFGGYRCAYWDQCEVPEDRPVAAPYVNNVKQALLGGRRGRDYDPTEKDMAMCRIHNKKRSLTNLVPGPDGRLECMKGGFECRSADIGEDGCPIGTAICSAHGKQRTLACLMDDGAGGKVCTEERECKVNSEKWARQRYDEGE